MNKLNKLFYLLSIALVPLLYSCEEDGPEPVVEKQEARYGNGVLVINQGNFSNADGTIDYYSFEEESLSRSIFLKENEEPIGGIIEDVAFHGDKAFIISNVADKIIITDADSLNEVATIQDAELVTPRYFAGVGNKGYVTVWGPYEEDWTLKNSKVAVLDLTSNSLLTTIPVPAGAEGIAAIGNKIFVANSSTDTITVIDTKTDAVIHKIKTASSPKHFVVDGNENLWVIYRNSLSQIDPDTYEELKSVQFEGLSLSGKAQLIDNTLYVHTSRWSEDYSKTFNAVYTIDISAAELAEELVLEKENMRAFGVDPEGERMYGGVAVGAESGTVVVFDLEGNELDNFAAGKFPHEIIIR